MKIFACALVVAVNGCWSGAAPASDFSIRLPCGETRLADIGLYRVWWQSYGNAPVTMPRGWTGDFDSVSGISYTPWNRVLGREALLMHSPWRVPPGKTAVDYELVLPRLTPIRLSFGIAMGPDAMQPGKSDGVTFSCSLIVEGEEHELMRKHHAKAEWLDYTFDLAPYGSKTVVVRLQVEPGPRNDPGWDFSFFSDAKITIGDAAQGTAESVRRFMDARAYRATESANRAALCNRSQHGVGPSNLLRGKNSLSKNGLVWDFVYDGPDARIVYHYAPTLGTLDDFTVQVDGGRPFQPALGGGARISLAMDKDALAPPKNETEIAACGGKPVEIRRTGKALLALWEYTLGGHPLRVAWTFEMLGKALVVSVRCDEPRVSRFSLGEVAAPRRKPVEMPYLAGNVYYLPEEGVFVCRYLDWTTSHASQCPQGAAIYEPKTDGSRNPLVETGYIAISPEVDEVLPNIPHPPSPFLSVLGSRVMLDVWGHHQGTFAGDAAILRELKDNGVDHLAIIQHDWQRYGYDVKLPDHIPANPAYGGDEGLIAFGKAANECGYLWSLHENYIDLYPDAPSYDPAARVLKADGTPSDAWFNAGTKVQSFGLKCNRALGFAKQNSPEAHRRYGTTAAYLDVNSCVPPWHQLDHDASVSLAAMSLAKVQKDTELFQFERDTHGGPLLGEGANHFYWAGRCDGVEAQVIGGEDHRAFLDFDLLKIHPQMVNHGMGYYERWFRRGYQARYGVDAGSIEQFDKYRAMEIAYGHAGFVSAGLVHTVQAVAREHHLLHPVQRLYATARPVEIRYEVGGQMVSGSAAIIAGDTARQRIRYDSGLTVWVNWRSEPWHVMPESFRRGHKGGPASTSGSRATLLLPQWGFLALGPDTEVSTALRAGRIADYAECPEYVFADARTWFDLPYRPQNKNVEPPREPGAADFAAHTNPAGTWVDFGAVATDGAVKINREKDRLVLFPYPREKPFRVSLDLQALAPEAKPPQVRVHALAAGSGQDLGPVECNMEGGRLRLIMGKSGAGRYLIMWR